MIEKNDRKIAIAIFFMLQFSLLSELIRDFVLNLVGGWAQFVMFFLVFFIYFVHFYCHARKRLRLCSWIIAHGKGQKKLLDIVVDARTRQTGGGYLNNPIMVCLLPIW